MAARPGRGPRRNARANTAADGSAIPTPESLPLLHKAALAACDGRDGLVDGQIDDPRACQFEPATWGQRGGEPSPGIAPGTAPRRTEPLVAHTRSWWMRWGEPAIRALLRGALAAAGGDPCAALPLALMRARREPALLRAIHRGLRIGLWRRLVREELRPAAARSPIRAAPTAATMSPPTEVGPAARGLAGAIRRGLRHARRVEALVAVVGELRDHHPAVVAMLDEAIDVAGGDVEAGVGLVMLRLHQVRSEDGAAVDVLLALAVALVVSEATEGHRAARTVRSRALSVLDRAAAQCEHSARLARHTRGAVESLRAARTALEHVHARQYRARPVGANAG